MWCEGSDAGCSSGGEQEGEQKLKQQQNLYEAVRSDRNLYSKNLIEAQDEIDEMKRKFKIMNHQIEQLKEEIQVPPSCPLCALHSSPSRASALVVVLRCAVPALVIPHRGRGAVDSIWWNAFSGCCVREGP